MKNNNYENLIKLIKKAQGDKTLNQFALGAKVNAGHLSRLLNGNFKNPPTPETLKKISNNSRGEVTYEELLKASGYIEDNDVKKSYSTNSIDKIYDKFNRLVENENAKVLFDKLGELNDEELEQVANIISIIKKDNKQEK